MNDDDFLKMNGFNFQKLMIDNDEHAIEMAKIMVPDNTEGQEFYIQGFNECTRQMMNSFEDCSPQKEINMYIDDLIDKLKRLKK